MKNPFDAVLHKTEPEHLTTDQLAHKLLDDVHTELRKQEQVKKNESTVGQIIDLAWDPVARDHTRLTGMARRLDAAAGAGDYAIIAAQQKIIEAELARDQQHRSRRGTIDIIAGDIVAAAPTIGMAAIEKGSRFIAGMHSGSDNAHAADARESLHIMQKPGDYREEITIDGQKRAYNVHVPKGYTADKPMPVVIMLHGITENADVFAERTQMNAKGDKEGFITVYPEGNPLMRNKDQLVWNVANWDIFHPARKADDVQFVSKVIDRIGQELSVDPNRTYLAGFSNGGMLAQQVAAENSDKLAAVALVGAALSGKDKAPKSALSVLDIHGTRDEVVPYEGWDNSLGIVSMQPVSFTGDYWKKADGIKSEGVRHVRDGLVITDAFNEDTGAEVKQIEIVGGTHNWPGDSAPVKADRAIEATDEIWDFFSRHTLGIKMASTQTPVPKYA